MGLVPLPNQPGAKQFLPHSRPDRQRRPAGAHGLKPGDQRFGRYIYSNRTRQIPGAFSGVVDGTGRRPGSQTIKTNAIVGGWTRVSLGVVNEFGSVVAGHVRAVHQAFGRRASGGAVQSVPIRSLPAAFRELRSYVFGGSASAIRSPACRISAPTSSSSSTPCRGSATTRSRPADLIMPMNNEFMDVPATQSCQFRGSFPGTPWPTTCSST